MTDTLLARALGRVFAHELAHRFLGHEHTRNGTLKDRLYQKDLIDLRNGGLFFSAEQIRLLRLRMAEGARGGILRDGAAKREMTRTTKEELTPVTLPTD